tara:strand:+ start:16954 stop:18804 length:1851 start_codon:yes stop_codon:yes gene_type:complete
MKLTSTYSILKGLQSLFLLGLLLILSGEVNAQTLPFREYTNPDEIVTFDRATSFIEAVEIINQFAQEYENKFIVDKSGYSGEIGVSLPAMHWKDALTYILQFRGLELITTPQYYEIGVRTIKSGNPQQQNVGAATSALPQKIQKATTATREVRINATFFEGNRRALQEIGVDWSTLTKNVPTNINDFIDPDGSESIPQTTFNDQFVSINATSANQVSQNVFNALVNFGEVGPVNVQALFSAFESSNLGNILATPSIKVIDGEQGKIQVGQDFSIKQKDFAGNVSDAFYSTGTILTVTPTVIEYDDTTFIHLDLDLERSTALPDAVSTIVNKQTAKTQTLLLNGEATSIAGLYRTDHTSVRRGVPILKDLPPWFFGLRYIFGYNSDDKLENELVILVQAELEKSLPERMNDALISKQELLQNERERFRNGMEYILEQAEKSAVIPLDVSPKVVGSPTPEVNVEPKKPDTTIEIDPIVEPEKELTEIEEKQLSDLSMPVKNPELMMVVPKAFNLDDYLVKQENGELEVAAEDKTLKYFVIGGSFIVPNNAYRFEKALDAEGFTSRILYNPSSKFNYVAYSGFSNYKEAVAQTLKIREALNPEAWLFKMEGQTEYKNQN